MLGECKNITVNDTSLCHLVPFPGYRDVLVKLSLLTVSALFNSVVWGEP